MAREESIGWIRGPVLCVDIPRLFGESAWFVAREGEVRRTRGKEDGEREEGKEAGKEAGKD